MLIVQTNAYLSVIPSAIEESNGIKNQYRAKSY